MVEEPNAGVAKLAASTIGSRACESKDVDELAE